MAETIKLTQTNFVRENNVYIFGDFDESISSNVVPELTKLITTESEKKNGRINFFINSNGGNVRELHALLALINMAKANNILITTTVLGNAYSCASMLAIVGEKRFIYEGAFHLMHLGTVVTGVETVEQNKRNALKTEKHFNFIVSLYDRHTKMPKADIIEAVKDNDYYIDAQDCIKLGFADFVITELYDEDLYKEKTSKKSKKTSKKKEGKSNEIKKDKPKKKSTTKRKKA